MRENAAWATVPLGTDVMADGDAIGPTNTLSIRFGQVKIVVVVGWNGMGSTSC